MATQEQEMEQATGPVACYHDRERWLEERRKSLGGSDIPAVFGLHPYRTELDVWRDKLGMGDPVEVSGPMRRGRALEDPAAEEYVRHTGRRVRRAPMRRHPNYPYLHASVDRQILAGDDHGTAALEIKCLGYRTFAPIKREGLPDYMILQGQLEAFVWGYPFTAFGILNPDSWKLLTFDVEADGPVQQRIADEAGEWWERHIVKGIKPEERTEALDLELPEVDGEITLVTDAELEAKIRELMEAREIRDEAKALYEAARDELKGALEPGVYEGGGARIHYQMQAGRRSFDKRGLKDLGPLDPRRVRSSLTEGGMNGRTLDEMFDEWKLDLDSDEFYRQGEPYEVVRPYRLEADADAAF